MNHEELILCWFCFQFFAEYNSKLLESSNYITRRQAIKVREASALLVDNLCWIIYFRKILFLQKLFHIFWYVSRWNQVHSIHTCLMCIFYLKPSSYYIDNIFSRSLVYWSSFCWKSCFCIFLFRAVFVVDIINSLENIFICTFWVGLSRNPLSTIKQGRGGNWGSWIRENWMKFMYSEFSSFTDSLEWSDSICWLTGNRTFWLWREISSGSVFFFFFSIYSDSLSFRSTGNS